MLLSTNQVRCQGSTVHRRALPHVHRLVKNLSIVKMENNGGTKHTGVPVKTLKKLLKKAGLKVSGKKATLTRRAKKAKLFGGLGRAPQSSAKSLFTKIASDQFNKEQEAIKAQQANFNQGINAIREQGEAANEAAKKERLRAEAQAQKEFEQRNVNSRDNQLEEGGKKKRSRRS